MWQQIRAIAWAQFRITRNHLPRTTLGTALMWLLSSLWNGAFIAGAIALALALPRMPLATIEEWLPIGLLGIFLYWQTIPLLTMSAGWGLQLNKLQIYPVRDNALFGIEVILRITAAPETILLLIGVAAGLLFHPGVPFGAPLSLLLFVAFNLFLQLAVRNLVTSAFSRSRFRELLTVLLISIGVLPQILLRTGVGRQLQPYFLIAAHGWAAPWHAASALALGSFTGVNIVLMTAWTALSFLWARLQFQSSLSKDETFRGGAAAAAEKPLSPALLDAFTAPFRDPMANLLQKELESLLRMPRFRVVFGMACVFGVFVFVPMTLGHGGTAFVKDNFLPVVNLYGMLILADVLLLNVFGLDRAAAQLFFVAPLPLRAVFYAKNAAALVFIVLQTLIAMACAFLFRIPLDGFSVASGLAVSAVASVFLLSAGNLLSVAMPRGIDPSSTLKKQAGAKNQLWLLLCTVGMLTLAAFPFLARWAFQKDWPFFAVLGLEFVIGVIFYWIALDSAVERALRDRERIVAALSTGPSPIAA